MCRVYAASFSVEVRSQELCPAGNERPWIQTASPASNRVKLVSEQGRERVSFCRFHADSLCLADKGTHLGALPYVGQLLNPAVAIVVATVSSLPTCYCIE